MTKQDFVTEGEGNLFELQPCFLLILHFSVVTDQQAVGRHVRSGIHTFNSPKLSHTRQFVHSNCHDLTPAIQETYRDAETQTPSNK